MVFIQSFRKRDLLFSRYYIAVILVVAEAFHDVIGSWTEHFLKHFLEFGCNCDKLLIEFFYFKVLLVRKEVHICLFCCGHFQLRFHLVQLLVAFFAQLYHIHVQVVVLLDYPLILLLQWLILSFELTHHSLT